jgi:hypothetical protein
MTDNRLVLLQLLGPPTVARILPIVLTQKVLTSFLLFALPTQCLGGILLAPLVTSIVMVPSPLFIMGGALFLWQHVLGFPLAFMGASL